MGMVRYWDYFNEADHVSVIFSLLFILLLLGYLVIVLFFALFRSRKLAKIHRGQSLDEVSDSVDLIHD